jgi:hypothetical protein
VWGATLLRDRKCAAVLKATTDLKAKRALRQFLVVKSACVHAPAGGGGKKKVTQGHTMGCLFLWAFSSSKSRGESKEEAAGSVTRAKRVKEEGVLAKAMTVFVCFQCLEFYRHFMQCVNFHSL